MVPFNEAGLEEQLPPSDLPLGAADAEPRKPKLSMKVLAERIQELQNDYDTLAARLDAIEKKSSDERAWDQETAAAVQSPFLTKLTPLRIGELPPLPELIQEVANGNRPAESELIREDAGDMSLTLATQAGFPRSALIPRSEKYPARKKRTWRLFRFLTRLW